MIRSAAMKAGRELDALVAEKVMGLISYKVMLVAPPPRARTVDELQRIGSPLPHYSTDISAAWEVVELFRRGEKTGRMVACCVDLHITDVIEEGGDSSCRIYGPTCAEVEARAPEMPLAICLAALKAVGVEVTE